MKTLIVIGAVVVALALVACPVFAGYIDEDENEIVKRHEKRMEKLMRGVQNKTASKVGTEPSQRIVVQPFDPIGEKPSSPPFEDEARKIVAEKLGINWNAVKVEALVNVTPSNMFGEKVYYIPTSLAILKHGNDEYYVQIKEGEPLGMHGNWQYTVLDASNPLVGVAKTILQLMNNLGSDYGLVYRGYQNTGDGTYAIGFIDINSGYAWTTVNATYDSRTGSWIIEVPESLKGAGRVKDPNLTDVADKVKEPMLGKIIPVINEEEIGQRKTVEAQVELKGNGKNYTVSPQMADAPKEGAQLQKKQ